LDTDTDQGIVPRAFTPDLTPDPTALDLGSLVWHRIGPDPQRPASIELAQVEHGVVMRAWKAPTGTVLTWSWTDWDLFRMAIGLGGFAFPDRGHPEPFDADDPPAPAAAGPTP
jgi:hypothetical protein